MTGDGGRAEGADGAPHAAGDATADLPPTGVPVPDPMAAGLLRDRYEPLVLAGVGGQGRVWRALDHQHERFVALKVRPAGKYGARSAVGRGPGAARPAPSSRTAAGARSASFVGDNYVLVMDWVEGPTLARALADRGDPGMPVGEVLGWLEQVAASLDHLHAHDPRVIHGDVKPANVVLGPGGRAVLVDFGLAGGEARRGHAGLSCAPEVAAGCPHPGGGRLRARRHRAGAAHWPGPRRAPARVGGAGAGHPPGPGADTAPGAVERPRTAAAGAGELVGRLRPDGPMRCPRGCSPSC